VHSSSADRLDIPEIVRHMVGRELKDFFPQREVKPGPIRAAVRDLSSASGIRNVSFEVRKGEIVGMAGLVGAGRTEVARAIFGVEAKTSGEILLDGKVLAIRSPADAIRRGIALLTEDRKRTGLCLELPCSQNITLPSLAKFVRRGMLSLRRETSAAAAMAARIDVRWSSPGAPAESLSGGNQQKLLVARWLLAESRFMIFDEPTRGIDVGAKREVYLLLNSLAGEGKAILFISSELPELFGVADRILVMRRGELVGNLVTSQTRPDEVMHLAAVE